MRWLDRWADELFEAAWWAGLGAGGCALAAGTVALFQAFG